MNYNDEQLLSIENYQQLAKAYSDALSKKGLKIISIEDNPDPMMIESIFTHLGEIKTHLLCLGGFLGTSKFYSLNERHVKKLSVIFDSSSLPQKRACSRDKTINFLHFLSHELLLIDELFKASETTTFEKDLKEIVHQRLHLLSDILSLR